MARRATERRTTKRRPAQRAQITLAGDALEWARRCAEERGVSVEAVVEDALDQMRQAVARQELLADLERPTPEELAEILSEWMAGDSDSDAA